MAQPQLQTEPTVLQMNPQPQMYDPSFMAPYPGQPAQVSFYDPVMPAFPQMDPKASIEPTAPAPAPAMTPVVQSQNIAPAPVEASTPTTYYQA